MSDPSACFASVYVHGTSRANFVKSLFLPGSERYKCPFTSCPLQSPSGRRSWPRSKGAASRCSLDGPSLKREAGLCSRWKEGHFLPSPYCTLSPRPHGSSTGAQRLPRPSKAKESHERQVPCCLPLLLSFLPRVPLKTRWHSTPHLDAPSSMCADTGRGRSTTLQLHQQPNYELQLRLSGSQTTGRNSVCLFASQQRT